MKKTIFFVFLCLYSFINSQNTLNLKLVEEINHHYSSNVDNFFKFKDKLFFTAEDYRGRKIWYYDGNQSKILLDTISPSWASLIDTNFKPTVTEKNFFFTNQYKTTLLASTGDDEGIKTLFKETVNTYPGGQIDNLIAVGQTLFFTCNDSIHGVELWKSDGTKNGTSLVKDIVTGTDGINITYKKVFNGKLYMVLNDGIHGSEIWTSDGTELGTHLLRDIYSGINGSEVQSLLEFSGNLYFVANNGIDGRELWKSDGTTNGTFLLKNINSTLNRDALLSNSNFIVLNNYFYFFANNGTNTQLWRSNGTSDGTTLFKRINTYPTNLPSYTIFNLIGASANEYFVFEVGTTVATTNQYNFSLWRSNGTDAGTYQISDMGNNYNVYNQPQLNFYHYNNKLVFIKQSNPNNELYITNGISGGTTLLTDTYQNYSDFKVINNDLFFKATYDYNKYKILKLADNTTVPNLFLDNILDPDKSYNEYNGEIFFCKYFKNGTNYDKYGAELWKSDYYGSNPILVSDINYSSGSSPHNFNFFYDKVLFQGKEYLSDGLYTYSPMNKEVSLLKSNLMFAANTGLYKANNLYYFNATDTSVSPWISGLYKSDGTSTGTQKIKNVNLSGSETGRKMVDLNNNLYFLARDPNIHYEGTVYNRLWVSDGTESGTKIIDNLSSTNVTPYFNSVIAFNGSIYFCGQLYPSTGSVDKRGMWKLNPTTKEITQIFNPTITYHDDSWSGSKIIGIIGNKLRFYDIYSDDYGNEHTNIYALDLSGTITLLNSFVGVPISEFQSNQYGDDVYTAFNNKYYIPFINSVNGGETSTGFLIMDDATENVNVVFDKPKIAYNEISNLTPCGDYLYFNSKNYIISALDKNNTFHTIKQTDGSTMMDMFRNYKCYNNNIFMYSQFHSDINKEKLEAVIGNDIQTEIGLVLDDNSNFNTIDGLFIDNYNNMYFPISTYLHGSELYTTDMQIFLGTKETDNLKNNIDKIILYPNPVINEINIKTIDKSKIKNIQLIDLIGKTLYDNNFNSNSVSLIFNYKINAGVYFIVITTENGETFSKKIIIN